MGMGQSVPMLGASPTPPPSSAPAGSVGGGGATGKSTTPHASASGTTSGTASGSGSSTSATPSPSSTGKLSRYETGGGVVVLSITSNLVTLVSATPAAGYSVQNWSAAGWLRVDFTEGSTVYSVYATWNGYSPQVQVVGPS
jgi:hypothetical protein